MRWQMWCVLHEGFLRLEVTRHINIVIVVVVVFELHASHATRGHSERPLSPTRERWLPSLPQGTYWYEVR